MNVGFIGIGNIGLPVAINLLQDGNRLTVYDKNPERMEKIIPLGPRSAFSPKDVAGQSEVVFTSLPNPKACEEVILGEEGVLAGSAPGLVLVEMSTTSPELIRHIGGCAKSKGVEVLDTGITKGVVHAAKGKTNLIVGGDAKVVNKVRPLFDLIAERVFHVGELGCGMIVKLINNLMAMVNLVTMCEAMALGVKAGISPSQLYEIVDVSSGASYQWHERGKRILDRDFEWGGVTLELACKDCSLIEELAREMGVPVYMISIAHQIYQHALAKEIVNKDRASVIMLWEDLIGKEFSRE